jgi:ADP-ribose pyrophosphatase YjhB (NUDIX family)
MPIPVSAGLALLRNDRRQLLLVHPTRAAWWATWSIPKGLLNPGESALDGAIRETREEIGVDVPRDRIEPTEHRVPYIDKKGRTTKIVAWFLAEVDLPETLDRAQLQLAEVDHAAFFDADTAAKRILGRLRPILEHLRT